MRGPFPATRGRYVREIRAAIERIAADPERGRARDEVRGGYRSYAMGSHAVIYVSRTARVDVIRDPDLFYAPVNGFLDRFVRPEGDNRVKESFGAAKEVARRER